MFVASILPTIDLQDWWGWRMLYVVASLATPVSRVALLENAQ
jgi:hypothetical protein